MTRPSIAGLAAVAAAVAALPGAPGAAAAQSHVDGRCSFDHDGFSATSETAGASQPQPVAWNGLPFAVVDPPPPAPTRSPAEPPAARATARPGASR